MESKEVMFDIDIYLYLYLLQLILINLKLKNIILTQMNDHFKELYHPSSFPISQANFSNLGDCHLSDYICCSICLFNYKNMMSIDNCPHNFCNSCMLQHIRTGIKKKFKVVSCPSEGCQTIFKESSPMFPLLTPQEKYDFKRNQVQTMVLNNTDMKICQKQGCLGYFKIAKKQDKYSCEICQLLHCGKCFEIQHSGECPNHDLIKFKQKQALKQCAKCKNMVQKNGGCLHMTCICGYQFCYYCGDQYNSNHKCNKKLKFIQNLRWQLMVGEPFYYLQYCPILRIIYHTFSFDLSKTTSMNILRYVFFLIFIYPFSILLFILLNLAVLIVNILLVILLIVIGPFLPICETNRDLPQRYLAEKSKLLAVIVVLLLYPVFVILTFVYFIYMFCTTSNMECPAVDAFKGLMIAVLMPCFIVC